RLAAGLLELERRPVRLGARHICRAPLCSRGMGARKLGQAWRQLGVGRWPLAALAAVRSDERRFGATCARIIRSIRADQTVLAMRRRPYWAEKSRRRPPFFRRSSG